MRLVLDVNIDRFTHILQGYFTGNRANDILINPVPVK